MSNREKLEGSIVNNLRVDEYIGDNRYTCTCLLCGGTRECRSYELKKGKYKACKECEKKQNRGVKNSVDLKGKTLGYWYIEEYIGNKQWRCKCTLCQRHFNVYTNNLVNGKSSSCVECSGKLKLQNDLTKKNFKAGSVDKYIGNSTWECTCGKCGTKIKRFTTILSNQDEIYCKHCSPSRLIKNMQGKVIGNWEVQEYAGNYKWNCKCNICGKTTKVFGYNLRTGHSKSCGCNQLIDLSNKKINEWTVIEYVGNYRWKCICSCGEIRYVHGYELRSGRAKSCGCKKWEYTKNTMLQRYNEVAQLKINNARTIEEIQALETRENMLNFINNIGYKPTTFELASKLGIQVSRTLSKIHQFGLEDYVNINSTRSKQHTEIIEILKNYIEEDDIIQGDRTILKGKELDIYIPSKKLAIEVNGVYWHSTLYKDKYYHMKKTLDCARQGIRLIHIFEYEWGDVIKQEKITNMLIRAISNNGLIPIHARDTYITEIDSEMYNKFLDIYHIQGSANAAIKIGCFYKDNIIGVMSFSTPRFCSNYQYELVRLCWVDNMAVSGGIEKMMNYFMEKYSPKSIITYCDISKFTGNSYLKIGFKPCVDKPLSEPNYVWVYLCNTYCEVLSRYQTQKHKLVELGLGDKSQTEDEIMEELGYLKIYDSGNIRLEWKA